MGFNKLKHFDPWSSSVEPVTRAPLAAEEVKLIEVVQEQNKHVYFVAIATIVTEEVVAAAAQAVEVVRLTIMSQYSSKSKEEIVVIKIQTSFQGYMVMFIMGFWWQL